MVQTYDVVISGAGVVGSCLALALGRKGLKVGLIDTAPLSPAPEKPHEGRAYAIAYGSSLFLKTIGVWESLCHPTPPPGITTIRTSQSGSDQALVYQASDLNQDALGFMVPSPVLKHHLERCLAEVPTVTRLQPAEITTWQAQDSHVDLTLQSGLALRTPLLVGAEGRTSRLREDLGGRAFTAAYTQRALVCTLSHSRPHQGIAFEHFTPQGPLALLPLAGNQSGLVWSLEEPLASAMLDDPTLLLHAVIHHFGWGLGDLQMSSPLQAYPLTAHLPFTPYSKRVLLIGDAAHVIHPVAGQGLNLGLRDAAHLADTIHTSYNLGLDWGSLSTLEGYVRDRRWDQWSMVATTHGLVHLFALQNPWVRKIRALGLTSIDWIPYLKKTLIRQAMGLNASSHTSQ